jgi:hypothetical protein
MRVLFLDRAGVVCDETTRDLAHYSDFDEIVVAAPMAFFPFSG